MASPWCTHRYIECRVLREHRPWILWSFRVVHGWSSNHNKFRNEKGSNRMFCRTTTAYSKWNPNHLQSFSTFFSSTEIASSVHSNSHDQSMFSHCISVSAYIAFAFQHAVFTFQHLSAKARRRHEVHISHGEWVLSRKATPRISLLPRRTKSIECGTELVREIPLVCACAGLCPFHTNSAPWTTIFLKLLISKNCSHSLPIVATQCHKFGTNSASVLHSKECVFLELELGRIFPGFQDFRKRNRCQCWSQVSGTWVTLEETGW